MRFYIETTDQVGILEYSSHTTAEEAVKEAEGLLTVGFKYAVVVDREECTAIAKFGDLPHDWK